MITNYSGNNESWHFKLNDVCDDKFPVLLIWHRWFRMTNWILFEVNFFFEKDISFCPPMFLEKKWHAYGYTFKCYTFNVACFRFYRFVPMLLEKIRQKKKFLKGLQIHISWSLVTDLENLISSYYQPLYIYTLPLWYSIFFSKRPWCYVVFGFQMIWTTFCVLIWILVYICTLL